MTLFIALLKLVAGFVLLMWSADRLVAGASALARILGVPSLIIGLTIIGFGTSAPEIVVSGLASFNSLPSLAIGNVVGSNIANIGLVLGLSALIYPLDLTPATLYRTMPVLALSMLAALLLMLDMTLGRIDGLILIALLIVMMGVAVFRTLHGGGHRPASTGLIDEEPAEMATGPALAWVLVGLVTLSLSAHVLVDGAVDLARIAGVSEAVIGLTIVALGTSLPETAAAIACAIKREDELIIGNVIGSNIFNTLGVLGIAALVRPMPVEPVLVTRDTVAMWAVFLLLAGLAWRRGGHGHINRVTALVLLVFYLGYQALVVTQGLSTH